MKHPLSNFNNFSESDDGLDYSCRDYRKMRRKEAKLSKKFLIDEVEEIPDFDSWDKSHSLIEIEILEEFSLKCLTDKLSNLNFEYIPEKKIDLIKLIADEYPSKFSKKCLTCKRVLPLPKFGSCSRLRHNLYSSCKNCEFEKGRLRRNTLDGFAEVLFISAKGNAKKRLERGRKEAGEVTITKDFLKNLIEERPYVEILPTLKIFPKFGDWQISLDRIDDSKGYIPENVRLFPIEMNGTSKWTVEKLKDVLDFAHSDPLTSEEIDEQLELKSSNEVLMYLGSLQRNKDKTEIRCRYCGEWKMNEEFHKFTMCRCKECVSNYAKNRLANLSGKLQITLKGCKQRSQRRSNLENDRGDYDLTLDDLLEIYKEQGGLCYYSGIPFRFGNHTNVDWIMSPERLDVMKGYVKDNVVLICLEFNTTDATNTTTEAEGARGWSREKFQVFYNAIKEYYG
jgi:hypothetical protein